MLAEIDENLIRNDLTASDKAILIPKREKLILDMDARDKEVRAKEREARKKSGGPVGPELSKAAQRGSGIKTGSDAASPRDLSAKTGISRTEVQRAKQRHAALGEEAVQAINRTDLDKPGEMDALAKLPEPKRAVLINPSATAPLAAPQSTLAPPMPRTPPDH
jgi:hypothetical protein